MRRHIATRFTRTFIAIFVAVSIVLGLYRLSQRDVAMAFKPGGEFRGTDFDKTHAQMVVEAVRELVAQENIIPGFTQVNRSMQKAIDDIKWADAYTDLFEYRDAEAHFTNDTYIQGQFRLLDLYTAAKAALKQNKVGTARYAVGRALHAIQDFYTHSNWVELGNQTINPNLANFDNILALNASSETGRACISCLQDECSTCVGTLQTQRLTTAWFQDNPFIPAIKPVGKCSHGGPGDFSDDDDASGGMNKDTQECSQSPHAYLHLPAAALAKEHTKQYFRFLRKNVTLREFKALLGLGNTLGFAIDTTGSMAEEIAGVKAGASGLVDGRIGTPMEPSRYLLVDINDPYVSIDADTDDPNTFKDAINSMGAAGGGDCPELTFMALLQALGRFDEAGGELMVFTDATIKDGALAPSVIALAQQKKVKITMMLSGSCSPTDPEYYRVSRETGGQTFEISETETSEAIKLADFAVRPDAVDIAHINGILSATPVTYTVPVDSTMTSLTFSISGATTTTINRPDSTTVLPTDPGVMPANISGGKVLSIANPTAGTWNVTVTGDGEFTMRIMGESPLRFSSLEFVTLGGVPGHEGYFPISGDPIAGQPSKMRAEVSAGNFNTAQFELRSQTGTLVQTLSLGEVPNLEGDTSRYFLGDATLPSTPVLVHVTGVDTNGQPYQRVVTKVIKPQTVQITVPPVNDIHPGRPFTFTAQITNHGANGNFALDVSDEDSFIGYVSPSAFTLDTGGTIEVTVTGQAPLNAASGTTDTVTLSVESIGGETKNYAATELNVLSEFEIRPQSVHGGKGVIGAVRLFGGPAPPGGTAVTLESSDPSVASVPATITVPEGRSYDAFAITTTTVATATPVTITATYGAISLTSSLQVVPAPDSLVSLELTPSTVKGGNSVKATVNLAGPAPGGGATITISSNHIVATVPASVTIPEEASSATFTITTASVPESTTANISAVYSGLTVTSALKVHPFILDNISIVPDDVAGGVAASIEITLSGEAPPGGAQIALESGNPSIATVPAQVFIPAGHTSATVLPGVLTTGPAVPTTVAIRGAYEGITTSGYLRVTPGAVPTNLYFDPSKLAGGQTSIGTVELNSPAPAGGTLVTLSTSDMTVVTVPASVTVPEGSTVAAFNISTSAVTSMMAVSIIASASGVGVSELLTVVPTALQSVSLVPSAVGAENTSTGQVTISNPAPTGGVLVALSSSDTAVATVPPTVTIPASATTATFSVNTGSIQLGATAIISANYDGETESATLRVFGINDVFGTIVPNGPPVTVTTTTSGQNARLVFEGTAGQRVSLKMSGVTISSSSVTLLKVDGSNLSNTIFVGTSGTFLDVTTLPSSGTHTIVIDPSGTATGSMTLQLYDVPADVSGSISIDGAPVTVTTTAPGQNAGLTFNGSADQRITVQISDVNMTPSINAQVSILNASQTVVVGPVTVDSNTEFIDTSTLASTGSYTLFVNPITDRNGSMTLKLNSVATDLSASITAGGAPVTVTTTSMGQNANVTFSGVSGQRVSLKVTGVTMSGGNGYVDITMKKPDGSTLAAATFVSSSGAFIDTQVLPATGTYNIFVNPQSSNTGSVTLTLYDVPADVTGSIVAGGPPVTVTTTVPGQNGVLSFNGTAGQRITVNIGSVSMFGGNGYLNVAINKPDSSQLVASNFIASGGAFINTQTLPTTGAYSILVNPQTSNTGSATLTLNDVSADVISTITPGGSSVTVTTTSAGQNAQVTFDGTSGQRVSLKITGVSLTGGNGYVDVYIKKPDGMTLGSTTFVNSSGGFIDTKTLPVTGTYTILVDPQGTNIGSVTLTLYDVPANVTGPIVPGGSSVSVTLGTPGQNAELAFAGLTGQRVFLRISSVSVTGGSPNWMTVSIKKPDGSSLASETVDASGGFIDTKVLPVDGAYIVLVDPSNSVTGGAILTLYDVPDDLTSTITPGDPPTTVTTSAIGQNAKLTFAGSPNQRIAVRVSSVSLTGGSPNWANVAIKKPDGSNLASTSVDSSGGFIDTTVLPVTGTYSLVVDPLNMSAGSVTITLYDVPADLTGPITFGSPLNVAINSVGQGASYTFSGTINQRISLDITNVSITSGGILIIRIKKPDGTTLAVKSVGSSGGYIDLTVLPVTGTYSVAVDPSSFTTGSCTLTLYEVPADVATSTTVNASAINISNTIPGQNILVTFPGTAGQQVTIRVTNNLIGSVFIKLFKPDGTQQLSYSHTSTTFNAPQQTLGTTGTYTILVDPFGNSVASMNLRVSSP